MKWISKWFTHLTLTRRPQSRKPSSPARQRLHLEALEDRCLLSGYATPYGLTPAQVAQAYGINAVSFNGVAGNGAGQTIAIVDPYDDPNLVNSTSSNFINSDLHKFDAYFGLPDPPSFTKVSENGGAALPGVDPVGPGASNWEAEEAMDVEWAHALAPDANIILVEASTPTALDMIGAGVNWARQQPGVSVVMVGYDAPSEFAGETAYDSVFTTPTGHSGVTFVAPTGDTGANGYASLSPNVLGVAATSLTLSGGNYGSETVWNNPYGKSGGGLSSIESRPSYQNGVAAVVGNDRGAPDVAFDGDPLTGVDVYDTYNGSTATPWTERGGTSLGASAWSAIVAVADQGRMLSGLGSLDGASQTLPMLYSLPSKDFHDVAAGSNGTYAAGPGYDLASGLGTPVANLVVADLVVPRTDDAQFVEGVYTDATGGLTAAGGFDAALAQVDAARAAQLSAYANTYVYNLGRPEIVQELYSSTPGGSVLGVGDLIGRALTTGEAAYWSTLLQNGMSYEQMIVQLTGSSTYYAESRVGGNDSNFVAAIYSDLLHRAAGSQGPLFVAQLNNAEITSRIQDAEVLLAGQTYETLFVKNTFQAFLNRQPSASELAAQLGLLNQGGTEEQVIANVLGSPSYYNDAPGIVNNGATGNTALVEAVYKQLLPGYPVGLAEINGWVNALNAGAITAQQMVNMLDAGTVYRFGTPTTTGNSGLVYTAYENYLGRPAYASDEAAWQSAYANPGFRTEDFYADVLGGPEYFGAKTTANTPLPSQDQQWADALYKAVLGATNETAESTQDLPFLAAAEATARAAVAQALVSSVEYHDDVITAVYTNLLSRPPSTYELNEWQPVVGQGATTAGGANGDERLLDGIFSSQEYFMDQTDPATGLSTNDTWLKSLYPHLGIGYNAVGESVELNSLFAAYAPARQAVVNAVVASPQYMTQVIQSIDATYLGRSAGPNDIAYGLSLLEAGYTPEQLIAAVLSSSEFYANAPAIVNNGATGNTALVEAVYKRLLPGYPVGQAEINGWVGALNAGAITVQQMVNLLDSGTAFHFGTTGTPNVPASYYGSVDRFFVEYLGRHASQAEITNWAAVFAANPNFSDQTLVEDLMNSEEYFLRKRTFA